MKITQLSTPCHSVAIMLLWSKDHRVFAYNTFTQSGESTVETQQCFRHHLNIEHQAKIQSRNKFIRWVNALRSNGSGMKT